jgi:hypothetical protein
VWRTRDQDLFAAPTLVTNVLNDTSDEIRADCTVCYGCDRFAESLPSSSRKASPATASTVWSDCMANAEVRTDLVLVHSEETATIHAPIDKVNI